MSRPGLPLVGLAAFLAVAVSSLVSAQEPKQVILLLAPACTRDHTSQHAVELP